MCKNKRLTNYQRFLIVYKKIYFETCVKVLSIFYDIYDHYKFFKTKSTKLCTL